jgi:chromosome segregation ATPase
MSRKISKKRRIADATDEDAVLEERSSNSPPTKKRKQNDDAITTQENDGHGLHSDATVTPARAISTATTTSANPPQLSDREWRRGAIVRILMRNFVTYSLCEVCPGPRLNLVIGPNGVGKSTLVCALALGLAGSPALLGRGKEVSDYIRHGHTSATLEIELYNGGHIRGPLLGVDSHLSTNDNNHDDNDITVGGTVESAKKDKKKRRRAESANEYDEDEDEDEDETTTRTVRPKLPSDSNIIIRRVIRRDNTSTWCLNGEVCGKKDIVRVLRELNVQVENLCQFLPQDKVASFAALDARDLLKETEHAVGGESLVAKHTQLIELRNELKHRAQQHKQRHELLEELKRKNQMLERDVLRFREREKCLKEVAQLELKRPWLLFEVQRQTALTLNNQLKEAKNELARYEREQEPLQRRIADLEDKLKENEAELTKVREQLRKLDQLRKQKSEQLEKLTEDFESLREELTSVLKRAEERRHLVAQHRTTIQTLTNELEVLQQEDWDTRSTEMSRTLREHRERLSEVRRQLEEVHTRVNELRAQLHTTQERQRTLQDERRRRQEIVRQYAPDAYQCWQWLQHPDHRTLFKGRVYGPVALELHVADPLHARYLEQQMPSSVMWAFICETPHDRHVLTREYIEKTQPPPAITVIVPSALSAAGNEANSSRYRVPLSELSRYGITHYLDQVFEAPPLVHRVVCSMIDLHHCAVGTHKTNAAQVLEHTPLQVLFTPDSHYVRTRSLYRAASSTTVRPLKEARIFAASNLRELEELEAQSRALQERIKEITDTELKKLTEEERTADLKHKELRQELDKILLSKKKIESLQRQRALLEKEIATIEKSEDVENERQRLTRAMKDVNERRHRTCTAMATLMRQLTETALSADNIHLTLLTVRRRLGKAQQERVAASAQYREKQTQLDRIAAAFEEAKAKAKELRDRAQERAPLTDEMKTIFAQLPNTIEELDERIVALKAKADLNWSANPKVIEDYEKRKSEMESLQNELQRQQRILNERHAEIEHLQESWLPELQRIVAAINTAFAQYMSAIGCVGEVKLHTDADDYANFGIEIWVKFRADQPLCKLDAHVQSGGERSVCTMLYLICLQDLTASPFRLVDEINQGMDPHNERMIFERVVHNAARLGHPQYFLITPKLLPDLHFTKEMTILAVLNGPWVLTQAQWNRLISNLARRHT